MNPLRILSRTTIATGLIVLAGISLNPATGEGSGSPPGETILPTDMCGRFFLVPLVVGGEPDRILTLLLDTGATHTVIDPDSAYRVTGEHANKGEWVKLKKLTSGPVNLGKIQARARNLDHISRALGRSIDGILGFPAFADRLLILDYPGRQVRLAEGILEEGEDVLALSPGDRARPWITLDIAGRKRQVLIDSGSGNGLVLYRSNNYTWFNKPLPVRSSMRINHLELREMGRLEVELQVGSVTLLHPLVELTSNTQLMGTAILKHFVLTFDQRNHRMKILHVGENPIHPPPFLGTGLVFNPKHAGLQVVRVLDGSPADTAGVRKGDTVTAVNGRSVHERDCGSFGQRFTPEDKEVTLTVKRRGIATDITVGIVEIIP
jgi:hypothetical protein